MNSHVWAMVGYYVHVILEGVAAFAMGFGPIYFTTGNLPAAIVAGTIAAVNKVVPARVIPASWVLKFLVSVGNAASQQEKK